MALTFDPSSDFTDVVDGTEAVTLERRGTSTEDSVATALRRAVTITEAGESNGNYTASDTTWHLSIAQLATQPRIGDVIVDASSDRWTVLDVAKQTLSNRWRCVCRNLAIVYGLDDYVNIQLATYVKGTAGTDESTWHDWKTGVRCRIQKDSTDIGITGDAETTYKRYTIFMATDVAITNKHRLKGPDGTVYEILGGTGTGQVGGVAEIEAEVRPWQ